jgi:hypothetical protein
MTLVIDYEIMIVKINLSQMLSLVLQNTSRLEQDSRNLLRKKAQAFLLQEIKI